MLLRNKWNKSPPLSPRKGEEKKDVIIANNHHFNNFPPPSGELEGAPLRDSLVTTFDNLQQVARPLLQRDVTTLQPFLQKTIVELFLLMNSGKE